MNLIHRLPWPSGYRKKQSLGGTLWVETIVEVYSGVVPEAWTPIDLSSHIAGANKQVWAYFVIEPIGGNQVVSFRPNGDTAAAYTGPTSNSTGWGWPTVLVPTDANGIVEWMAPVGPNVKLTLFGYVSEISTLAPLNLLDGEIASGFTTFDASAGIDAVSMVALRTLENVAIGSGEGMTFRPRGAAGTWSAPGSNSKCFTSKIIGKLDVANASMRFSIADALGLIDVWSEASENVRIDVHSFVAEGFFQPASEVAVVFPYAESPTVATDLDLSGAIGAQKSLVFLSVRGNGGSNVGAIFRPDGTAWSAPGPLDGGNNSVNDVDSSTYSVIIPCNENGVVEWRGARSSGTPTHEIIVLGWIPEA